jgi:hypothetical protein
MPDGTIPGAPGVATEIPVNKEEQVEVAQPTIEGSTPKPEVPAIPGATGVENTSLEAASAAIDEAAAIPEAPERALDGVRPSPGEGKITSSQIREGQPHEIEGRLVDAQNQGQATEEPPAAEVLPEGEEGEPAPTAGQPLTGEPPAVSAVPPVPGGAAAGEPIQEVGAPVAEPPTGPAIPAPAEPVVAPAVTPPALVEAPATGTILDSQAPSVDVRPPVFEDQGENLVQPPKEVPPDAGPVFGGEPRVISRAEEDRGVETALANMQEFRRKRNLAIDRQKQIADQILKEQDPERQKLLELDLRQATQEIEGWNNELNILTSNMALYINNRVGSTSTEQGAGGTGGTK